MSDYSSFTIQVQSKDREAVIEAVGFEPDNASQHPYMDWDQVAWGGDEALDKLDEQGIPYLATWADGGGYGPGSAASDGKRKARVNDDWESGWPTVTLTPHGFDEQQLRDAQLYLELYATLNKTLREEPA